MGYRAHVQTKHIIEYGNCHFNWQQEEVYDWLTENGVYIYGDDDLTCYSHEWEIEKSDLEKIPETAYATLNEGTDDEITADELREFVKDMLDAPTGQYVYISWY